MLLFVSSSLLRQIETNVLGRPHKFCLLKSLQQPSSFLSSIIINNVKSGTFATALSFFSFLQSLFAVQVCITCGRPVVVDDVHFLAK